MTARGPFYQVDPGRVNAPRRHRPVDLDQIPSDKQARYGLSNRLAGRCPHCGKPCSPYGECEQRRVLKRVSAMLHKMARLGLIAKIGPSLWLSMEYVEDHIRKGGTVLLPEWLRTTK